VLQHMSATGAVKRFGSAGIALHSKDTAAQERYCKRGMVLQIGTGREMSCNLGRGMQYGAGQRHSSRPPSLLPPTTRSHQSCDNALTMHWTRR